MNSAFVFFADGFEEIEALTVVDILRRADIPVTTVSIKENNQVEGTHRVSVLTDTTIARADLQNAACLILPGGMPGAANLMACDSLREAIRRQHEAARPIAAICAAPMILGDLGISVGRKMTCYPGFEEKLTGAQPLSNGVVRDEHIITGRGPAYAADFALEIVSMLCGNDKAKEVSSGMLLK